jgi:hypothetical protein
MQVRPREFDLIAEDDVRLPPKAVFGVALSLALDGEVDTSLSSSRGSIRKRQPSVPMRCSCYAVIRPGERSGSPARGSRGASLSAS